MNDGGTFEVHPKELELKKENVGNQNATFLDIDIKIMDKNLSNQTL